MSEGERRSTTPTQTLVREGDALKLRVQRLAIEIAAGPGAGQVTELAGPEVRVGSGRDCDLVVADAMVSRHHLTLVVAPRGVRVIDAGSRNGTRVDGLEVIDAYARADSAIAIGQTTLRLRLLPSTIDVPLHAGERFGAMLGRSVPMRRMFAVLERVAGTDTTVLIEGETGTGKELVAEAIHETSARRDEPFVVLDCSSVSPQLAESELFGHLRGAFTGAVADRVGAFEAAAGGTLFLDEIGELTADLQPKLLRALERREVRPVGSHERRTVDVRVVAATNRDLAAEVDRGAFREDLYYRLAVIRVVAPPLRERGDDVGLLARHFAESFGRRHGRAAELTPRQLRELEGRAWPGNVRELRNAVDRILSIGGELSDHTGPAAPAAAPAIDLSVPLKEARDGMVERFEAAYLQAALEEAGGNVTRAAEIAGVHRRFVHRAINRYRLRGDTD